MLIPAIGDAHDRRKADDRPLAARFHAGHGWPDNAKHPLEVDIKGVIPFLVRQLFQWNTVRDACIGHDRVYPAKAGFDVLYHRIGTISVAHIEMLELRLASGLADLLHDAAAFVLENVGGNHMITARCKSFGGGTPYADTGARDQSN